jgi:hypothetical protein
MVAYSFKSRFVEPIRLGLEPGPWTPGMKRQTIRADRKRHARPGEELQHYCGMRTAKCFLIGRAICEAVKRIWLAFDGAARVSIENGPIIRGVRLLDDFARHDGFGDWGELHVFWKAEHEALTGFEGVIVYWAPREAAS